MKRLLVFALALALLLSACGKEQTPTMTADEVAATAVAAAWTMVAETQAAIPTNTPVPPTDTPAPTLVPTLAFPTTTPLSLPTQGIASLPTNTAPAASSGNTVNCNAPLDLAQAGPKTPVKIINKTKVSITVTVGFSTPSEFGQCGYLSYQLGKNETVDVGLPKACYWAYAWVNDPKNPSTAEGYGMCVNGTDKIEFQVYTDTVKRVGP